MLFTDEEAEIIYAALKKEYAERCAFVGFLGRHMGVPESARRDLQQLEALAERFRSRPK